LVFANVHAGNVIVVAGLVAAAQMLYGVPTRATVRANKKMQRSRLLIDNLPAV
jgi:hypothetical protein